MINKNTGEIYFKNLVIKPYMKFNELIENIPNQEIISCDYGNPISVCLRPQLGVNNFFFIRMYFNNKDESNRNLEWCQLVVQDNDIVPSWDNWSEECEKKKKRKNDEWLLKEVGVIEGTFTWGGIGSYYDSRAGSSYIAVRYDIKGKKYI